MDDDRVQKSKDRIDAWTAQQAESVNRSGAAQTDATQPQTEPADMTMEAPREDAAVIVPPDGVETVLEDAPCILARDRVRFKTPDRPPAIKRSQGEEGGPDTIRRLDDRMDNDGLTEADSPLQQWYGDATEGRLIDGASMDPGADDTGAACSNDVAIDVDTMFDALAT